MPNGDLDKDAEVTVLDLLILAENSEMRDKFGGRVPVLRRRRSFGSCVSRTSSTIVLRKSAKLRVLRQLLNECSYREI